MSARKLSLWIFLGLSPIMAGMAFAWIGGQPFLNQYGFIPLCIALLFTLIASLYFLKNRLKMAQQVEKGWNIWVGGTTICWMLLVYFALGSEHIIWIVLPITLFQGQFLIWYRYPQLTREKLSQRQKIFQTAIPIFTMVFGVITLGIISLVLPPEEPKSIWDWAQILSLTAISVPVGMLAGMYRTPKPKRIAKPSLPSDLSPDELLSNFTWKNPETDRYILARLEKVKGYDLIPKLEALTQKLPRAFYHLNFDELLQMEVLKETLKNEVNIRLKPNISFQEAGPLCWCRKCSARSKTLPIGQHSLRVCRMCETDDHLTYPVRKVVGVLGNGESEPAPTGIWHLQSWNDASDTFIPADYDEILLKGDFPLNYDWYIVALANWLDNYFAVTGKPITVTIMRAPQLSENAHKLLDAAESEGKLNRKYQ